MKRFGDWPTSRSDAPPPPLGKTPSTPLDEESTTLGKRPAAAAFAPEEGLPSRRRVMSRYAFCQALTPELEHDGGPCDRSCWVNHFD